jgi:hypothetical protein
VWRQRKLAKAIRERELRKFLARPPEPPAPEKKPEKDPVEQQPAQP